MHTGGPGKEKDPPADRAGLRRRRLEQLIDLALAYRDCTRKELARTLGRDPTKLVPGTGVPKLDLVVGLAGVLDWPVGDVVSFLWRHPPGSGGATPGSMGRARAGLRDAAKWRQAGRYREVLQALAPGLREAGVAPALRRTLRLDLAAAYYALWSVVEARAVARELLAELRALPSRSPGDRRAEAWAAELAGQAARRLIGIEPQRIVALAAAARIDLEAALGLYRRLRLQLDDPSLEGPADRCIGALVETDVVLQRRSPGDALAQLSLGLERARDASRLPPERLEPYGWWCIYGCNIALRHLTDERELQQHMAVFTNKADEIATLLDDWPMRERVFTMQYTRWKRAAGSTCFEIPCVIDRDDVRVITGTMGRFPAFRPTGWRILQTAQIVAGA